MVFRVRLSEQHRGGAEAAAEVGHPPTGRQLRLHAVQRRDPAGHQLGHVAGPVERIGADEHVVVVLVPAEAGTGPERLGELRFSAQIAEDREGRRREVRAFGLAEVRLFGHAQLLGHRGWCRAGRLAAQGQGGTEAQDQAAESADSPAACDVPPARSVKEQADD